MFTFRKQIRLGPIRWNFGKHGFTSWGIKLGPFSWNSRTRQTSVDLPGPVNYRTDGKR